MLWNCLYLRWAPWFPPWLCSLLRSVISLWVNIQTKGCLPKVRQAACILHITKGLLMPSLKSSKASAMSRYPILMTKDCIRSPFICLQCSRWTWVIKVKYSLYWMKTGTSWRSKSYSSEWNCCLSIFLPPFPLLFLPLLLPSSPPPPPLFSPQQDAAWTSARCHGNQDWGGFSCDWISLSTDWPDALM